MRYFLQLLLILSISTFTVGVVNAQDKLVVPSKRSLADLQALPDDTLKVLIINRVAWDTAYFSLALGLEYAQEALKVGKRINFTRGIIIAYNTLGATYCDMGNYDDALQAHMEGLKNAEKYGDPKRIGTALMNISLVYNSMKDTANSTKFLERAILEFEKVNHEQGLAVAYINLGGQYFEIERLEQATICYQKALSLGRKSSKAEVMSHAYSGLALCVADSGAFELAHKYIDSAFAVVAELNDPYVFAKIQANLATLLVLEKKYPEAEAAFIEAMATFRGIGVREEVMVFYMELSDICNLTNRPQEALEYWKKYMILKDSLVNEDVLEHQRNLEALYESEKKKQEIELLTTKGNVRQWFLVAIGACFIVLIFLTIMLYKRNQFRKKTNQETALQNSLIHEQTREITDSISYASRIQEAVIPDITQLRKHFTDAFVLSKPKDIVSGDFWWCTEKDGKFFLAGADSTGHGVPGGFMSMLGSVFLFEIITENGTTSTASILNSMRDKVISTLNRSGIGKGVKDGMDMVMCAFSENNSKVEFSCAMNPLWVIRNKEVIEYRADKFPVGEYHGEVKSFSIQTHDALPGDMIYIFSDGYADQFGGPAGKKLKYKQFREILCAISNLSCAEQHKILVAKFAEWKNDHEQVDDVLVIGIRV